MSTLGELLEPGKKDPRRTIEDQTSKPRSLPAGPSKLGRLIAVEGFMLLCIFACYSSNEQYFFTFLPCSFVILLWYCFWRADVVAVAYPNNACLITCTR